MPARVPRRIATISLHTSPLEQPGTGDAGGLNVYVVEVAKRMAARGVEVEIFTRAVSRDAAPVHELVPGVLVRHVQAGPFEELDKADLPAQLCEFTLGVLRTEAAYAPGRYDLVHGHYWLSGHVGAVAKERWGVPFVQSMHTLGRVKNAALARGDMREPDIRLRGESDVVASADRLVANTDEEARQLARLYGAEQAKIWTVNPGVDLSIFRPGQASAARRRLGLPEDGPVIVFAGRIQPLKAPDVVLHAAAELIRGDPALAQVLTVAFVGGPSGTGRADPDQLTEAAQALRLCEVVRVEPPCPQSGTRRLVPGRHGGHGPVLLGVVRAGSRRGAGLRHTGGRGLGGRPAHRGPGRCLRHPHRRARPGPLRRRPAPAVRLPRAAGQAVGGRRRAREPVRLGKHGRPPAQRVPGGHERLRPGPQRAARGLTGRPAAGPARFRGWQDGPMEHGARR